MNLNIHKSQGAGGEGPYTYSWRVGRILHLIGVGSLPLLKIRGQIRTHKSWYCLIDWTLSLLNSLLLTTMKGMWHIPSTQPSKNNACDIPSTQLSKNTNACVGVQNLSIVQLENAAKPLTCSTMTHKTTCLWEAATCLWTWSHAQV